MCFKCHYANATMILRERHRIRQPPPLPPSTPPCYFSISNSRRLIDFFFWIYASILSDLLMCGNISMPIYEWLLYIHISKRVFPECKILFFSNLSLGNLISPRTFVLLFLCVLLLSVASLSLRPYIGPSVVTVTFLSANCSSEHLLPLKFLICMNGGLSRSWPRPGCPPTPPCRSAGLIGCPRQRMSCRLHHQTKEIMLLFCADKRRRQKNVSFGWCAKQSRGPPPPPPPPTPRQL